MDPQSQSFTPYSSNETWRLQTDVARIQQLQAEHAERIARLERRADEDARMKSVWGNQSPFPSVLSGTPLQAPLSQPSSEHLRGFDDEANNLISNLHLDAEEEPRRGMGATSRANSVRFDESANQNHLSHSSRPSVDLLSRAGSGLGGLAMTERTPSHKSDARASSAHSMRSAASGRANSLNLDTGNGINDVNRSPLHLDTPGLAPGLLLLGTVPAIIRCWMNTNFKHDALLYAAVCTGSYKSFLHLRLIEKLGFTDEISNDEEGMRTINLPVFFPEAVPHPASSRPSSPAPQLPTLTVDFQVVEYLSSDPESKAIQIFLGSDTLRAHNADILFSSNSMTIFDDDRSKLSIPLVRPEKESVFRYLYTTTNAMQPSGQRGKAEERATTYINGLGASSSAASVSSAAASPPPDKYRPSGALAAEIGAVDSAKAGAGGSESGERPSSPQSNASRPSLSLASTRTDVQEQTSDTASQTTSLRSAKSPAIWSNWRRDGSSSSSGTPQAAGLDWAATSRNRENTYQRKDTGIKVLKPKTASRTFSTGGTASLISPSDGRSRFFDEGRTRSGPESDLGQVGEDKRENQPAGGAYVTEATAPAPKAKANPIGGGSAFTWLNAGSGMK